MNKPYDESKTTGSLSALLGLEKSPGQLFHYTNGQGLHGILKSASLWLTHVRFLNDRSEFEHALRHIEEVIAHHYKRVSPDNHLLAAVLTEMPSLLREMQIWTFSLSEEPDSVSQWQAYTGGRPGYAIGFNRDVLESSLKPPLPECSPAELFECEYNEHNLRRDIDNILGYLGVALGELASDGEVSHQLFKGMKKDIDIYSKASLAISGFALQAKHYAFAAEKESRIVVRSGDSKGAQFRIREGIIIPYLELCFDSLTDMGISQIVVGPSEVQADAVLSVKMLLDSLDLETEVRASSLPLR